MRSARSMLVFVAAVAVGCTDPGDRSAETPVDGREIPDAAPLDAFPAVCGNDLVEPGEGCEPGSEPDPRCTADCRIAPGASITIATNTDQPDDVTVGAGQVFWTEFRDTIPRVYRVELDGTPASSIDTGDFPVSVAFHGGLYIGREYARDIVLVDGATLTPACGVPGGLPTWIAGGPRHLYASMIGNFIVACRYGVPVQRWIALDFDAFAIAAAPDGLYIEGRGELHRMSYDDETTTFIQLTPGALDIAADETHVYYVTSSEVVALPLGGGVTQVLGTLTAPGARAVAVDDGAVYVADRGGNAIIKFPKP